MNLTLQRLAAEEREVRGAASSRTTRRDISPDMSFLEMLDVVNEQLIAKGEEPIAFDHDCREGICGMCGSSINGSAARPAPAARRPASSTCAASRTATTITIEPWRATAVPGDQGPRRRPQRLRPDHRGRRLHLGARPAARPTATRSPSRRTDAERAMDAAACIGCGACVAACPNASAMLFVAAKVSHLALLPQGQPERDDRVLAMVAQMDAEGFGTLHEPRRVQARLPEGDPPGVHRAAQPRLPVGEPLLAPEGRRGCGHGLTI